MTNYELKNRAENIALNYRTAYVWGAFGLVANASNMQRMINQYSKNNKYLAKARAIYGNGYFFDCVGLIKGILWGWCGNSSKTYGGASYASNRVPDISADQMISHCTSVSMDFSNIVVGEAVWLSGHIGIYIGNGKVVEATPSWSGGVQISDISKSGKRTKNGSGSAYWKKHGKLPYVSYDTEEDEMTTEEKRKFNALVNAVSDLTVKVDNLTATINSLTGKMIYTWVDDNMPKWARPTIQKLLDKGYLKGDEENKLNLDDEMLRTFVILDRAGVFNV